jgi:uncharacterized protein (DUF2384 family)
VITRFDITANLDRIRRRLAEYYTPDEIDQWLASRHKLLDEQRPVDLIFAGEVSEIDRLLDQLDDGAYL